MLDFELGLDHTGRPQPYSEDVHLCRHILRGSDADHVLEETEESRRGGGGCIKVRGQGEKQGRNNEAANKREYNQVPVTGV